MPTRRGRSPRLAGSLGAAARGLMPTPKTEVHKPKTTTAAPTPATQASATEHGGAGQDSNTNNYGNQQITPMATTTAPVTGRCPMTKATTKGCCR